MEKRTCVDCAVRKRNVSSNKERTFPFSIMHVNVYVLCVRERNAVLMYTLLC